MTTLNEVDLTDEKENSEKLKRLDELLQNLDMNVNSNNIQIKSYEDLVAIDNLIEECEKIYRGEPLESRKKYYFELQFGENLTNRSFFF